MNNQDIEALATIIKDKLETIKNSDYTPIQKANMRSEILDITYALESYLKNQDKTIKGDVFLNKCGVKL